MGHFQSVEKWRFYVNGCSWTDGDVLDLRKIPERHGLEGVGRDYSYPTLVQQHFNFGLIDESRYGGSLNRIIRMSWDFILRDRQSLKDTIFLFEIPNGFREEIYSTKFNRYFNITSGLLDFDNDATEISGEYKSIKNDVVNYFYNFISHGDFCRKEYINFMTLLLFLKNNDVPFFIMQFDELLSRYDFLNDVVSNKNLIQLENCGLKKRYELIQNMCEEEKLSIGDELDGEIIDTHPGISGHRKISEIIINHFDKHFIKKII